MPKVSIIVPVFNTEEYLHRCINSILNQTLREIEVILINDGSTDKSGEICEEYAKKDSRVIVIHKKNGGPAEARNLGIDMSSGEYLGFVDSDDFIDEKMYEKLHRACTEEKVEISVCGRFDVHQNRTQEKFTLEKAEKWTVKESIRNLLVWNNIDSSVCDKLFHSNLFTNIKFPLNKNVEDIYVLYKLLYSSNEVLHIAEPLYYYCHRPYSRSGESFSVERLDILEVANEIKIFIHDKYPDLILEAENFYFVHVIILYELLWPKNIKKNFYSNFREVNDIINFNLSKIINNKYISTRNKIIAITIFFRSYGIVVSFRKAKQRITKKITTN